MGRIVAIGGGELSKFETFEIDKKIVELTGKERPHALFVPTASGEPPAYCQTFEAVYGERLGCATDMLFLTTENPSKAEIEDKIFSSDLVYVGGGDTRMMMKVWESTGVDKLLLEAYKKHIVLSGLSAGAICWFKEGFSDSEKFSNQNVWNYIGVKGLGLINAIFCPHLNENDRRPKFMEFMKTASYSGLGLENNCAIEEIDGKFNILSAGGNAFLFKNGVVEILRVGMDITDQLSVF